MSSVDYPTWRSAISQLGVALFLALSSAPSHAQPDLNRRIDGSTKSSFEESLAALQNELRPRRRTELETSLAVLWMRHTVASGDRDADRDLDLDLDLDDFVLLEQEARDLLTQIQRGNLLSAIEERAKGVDRIVTEFIGQLDGLGDDEVLDLAGRPSEATLSDLRLPTARAWDPRVDLCKLFPPPTAGPLPPEPVPIVRVAPRYPGMALDDGLSGAVCLEFALDHDGVPTEVVVVGSTANVFEQPALVAFTRWRYPPRVEPGRLRMQMVFYLTGATNRTRR